MQQHTGHNPWTCTHVSIGLKELEFDFIVAQCAVLMFDICMGCVHATVHPAAAVLPTGTQHY